MSNNIARPGIGYVTRTFTNSNLTGRSVSGNVAGTSRNALPTASSALGGNSTENTVPLGGNSNSASIVDTPEVAQATDDAISSQAARAMKWPTMTASMNYGNTQAALNTETTLNALENTTAATELTGVAEASTVSGLESVATNPIANFAGMAVGQGISHIPDIELSQANTQLSNTYNSAQRVEQEKSIASIQNTANTAQIGADTGSIVPIVGSAIGAAIGAGVGASEQTQGSDLSSPEETAQL